MKLNELKQPTKEAIDWSPFIGHYGQSFLGDKPAGADREGKIAKNIFVRNFMLKVASGLESAINSHLVDPNAASTYTAGSTHSQPVQPAQPGQAKPSAKTVPPNVAPASNPPAAAKLPPHVKAAQKNIDKTAAPFSKLPANTPAKTKGVSQAEIDADRQRLVPDYGGANESKYNKFNYIIESIINIDEAGPNTQTQPSDKQSISQYVQRTFMDYMKGVPINDPRTLQQLKTLADAVQTTYSKDKGKEAFTKLADLAWAVSQSPEAPVSKTASAGSEQDAQTQQNNVAAQQSNIGVRQINKIIPTLRKRDLLSVKKTIDNILASRGITTAAPQTAPTPTSANVLKMPKGKVRASKEGGVTPEEQAKFDEKVKQALASQK